MIIQLPKPHSQKQSLIMHAMQTNGLLELWVACGTKAGKTTGASCAVISKFLTNQNLLFRWVAPIYSQAKIGFNNVKLMLPSQIIEKNLASMTILQKENLSTIEFKSGKFPEDLEGEAVTGGYVLDECAKMSEQVYDSAKTTLTVTRAPMINISTPRGKNWFYKKCMEAKEEMQWHLDRDMPPPKIFITAPSIDNPLVTPEAIADAIRSLPERLYRQYYLAEFVEDGSVFVGVRDVTFEIGDTQTNNWYADDACDKNVVIGVDWAKSVDYTVFFAFDIETGKAAGYWRFNKLPYTEAVRRLMIFCKTFREVSIIKHDKTGVGNALDDQLAYINFPYSGVTFTNAIKSEMVSKLMTSIEQKLLSFPKIDAMLDEFDYYDVTTNGLGNTTYGAIAGKHDDIVTAILLANVALIQYGQRSYEINFLENLPNKKESISPIEKFYIDLADDDD